MNRRPVMTKQQQWRLAAVVIANVDLLNTAEAVSNRDYRALKALSYIYDPLPWEYPWQEVIRSHRDRSETRLARSSAKA